MAFSASSSFAIRLVLIIVAVLVLVVLVTQYQRKKSSVVAEEQVAYPMEGFEEAARRTAALSMPVSQQVPAVAPAEPVAGTGGANGVRPNESLDNEDYKAVDFSVEQKVGGDCFPRDKSLTAADLLPKDAANSTWAQVVPASQGDVDNQNYLTAGFHMGINTISSTNKIASYDLRSTPPNPKLSVSPWMNSTVEPDQSRRYFEIGEC